MKKNLIFFGILTVRWACQNDYDHNYGINEPIDCSLWEYLQSDHYNFDSIVVAVRHAAGLELDLVAREGSFCISKSSLLLCGFTKRRLCYRLPSPVIRVMRGKGVLLHLDLKTFLIKLR